MPLQLPWVFATSFVTAVLAILLLSHLAPRIGLIDPPGERKRHHGPVPLVGGIAVYLGVLANYLWSSGIDSIHPAYPVACGAMLLIGVADDRHDINPRWRLILQAATAVAMVLSVQLVVADLGDLLGSGTIQLGWAALPFTIIAMVALINAFNMLDGLDGLAGSVALLAFAAMTAIGLMLGRSGLYLVGTGCAGALLGFLLFNAPIRGLRRKLVFMGDAGSTFLGFAFAACALAMVRSDGADVPPPVILWLVAIPIFELFMTFGRRLVKRLPPMQADRGHYHYWLLDAGWPVTAVFGYYFLWSALSVGIGLAMYAHKVPDVLVFLGFVAWFGLWNLVVFGAPGDRREGAPQMD